VLAPSINFYPLIATLEILLKICTREGPNKNP